MESFYTLDKRLSFPPSFGTYTVVGQIGSGAFSEVVLAYNNIDGKNYACKVISREKMVEIGELGHVEQEIAVVSKIHHPSIVLIKKVINIPDFIIIVMDYCSRGNLYDLLISKGHFSDAEIRKFVIDIVEGLVFLHSQGIAHRDIKLDNIVLSDDMHAKLIDFGFCTSSNNLHTTICGTLEYNAPEVLREEHYDPIKADIWSLGVCIYTMAKGQYPWAGSEESIIKSIISGRVKYSDDISAFAKSLIRLCLVLSPNGRATAKDLHDRLDTSKIQLPILPTINSEANSQRSPVKTQFKIKNTRIGNKNGFVKHRMVPILYK